MFQKSELKTYFTDWPTIVYDQKTANKLQSSIPSFERCKECNRLNGVHEPDCSKVDLESLAGLLKVARKAEFSAKKTSARYLHDLQTLSNKLCALKWENNKLRKANEQLRKQSTKESKSNG